METVIRSPQKGVVKKLAHKEGVSIPKTTPLLKTVVLISSQDICKAGTVLVLFEDAEAAAAAE